MTLVLITWAGSGCRTTPSCGVCFSVPSSATFVCCIETRKHIVKRFLLSDSLAIVLFLYQTLWLMETWSSLVLDDVSGIEIQCRRSCGVEQFAAGHSYCINTLYFQKSAQDLSIFSFISIINLISRSVCCTAPL